MIQYVGYGVLLAIGYHIGGKIARKLGMGTLNKNVAALRNGEGINTGKYRSKIQSDVL
jgi:hypothetical protein